MFSGKSGEKPRNLALEPVKGLLFWTDVGINPRIVQARLNGEKQTTIFTDGQIVDALAVDCPSNLLFFSYGSRLYEFNLSERTKRLLLMAGRRVGSLAAIQSFLYFVDRDVGRVERVRVDANTIGNRTLVLEQTSQIIDMIAVYPVPESYIIHPCSSFNHHGNCSHLCVRSIENPKYAECICPLGWKLKEDRKNCQSQPPCGPESFICRTGSGDCIPSTWKCDGQSDCLDGSDEEGCAHCSRYDFKCNSGHCVASNVLCDGVRNCPDGSDEMQCCSEEILRSDSAYFQCVKDLSCIPSSQVCDGFDNCADGSDELAIVCNARHLPKNDSHIDDNSSTVVTFALVLIVLVLAASALVFRCTKKFKRPLIDEQDMSAMRPLAPGLCPQISPITATAMSIQHSMTNGDGSIGSYGRSHITGTSSSMSMNNCPLNPPPSPSTTAMQEEYCCNPYSEPTPTPCSTDVCDESDSNYRTDNEMYFPYKSNNFKPVSHHKRSTNRPIRHHTKLGHLGRYPRNGLDYDDMTTHNPMYKSDFDQVPPPTPRSSSDPPSPSSSMYFSPIIPHPPPPSPTNH